jgi:DNA-binding CsgD family transcriptional regulator
MVQRGILRVDSGGRKCEGAMTVWQDLEKGRLQYVVGLVATRYTLGRQERRVLLRAAAGIDTKEIAHDLGCSPKTVEEYWMRILRKSGLQSRNRVIAEILAEALSKGLGIPTSPRTSGDEV